MSPVQSVTVMSTSLYSYSVQSDYRLWMIKKKKKNGKPHIFFTKLLFSNKKAPVFWANPAQFEVVGHNDGFVFSQRSVTFLLKVRVLWGKMWGDKISTTCTEKSIALCVKMFFFFLALPLSGFSSPMTFSPTTGMSKANSLLDLGSSRWDTTASTFHK